MRSGQKNIIIIKKVVDSVFSIQKIVLYLRLPLLCVNALSVFVRSISGHFCSKCANSKRTEMLHEIETDREFTLQTAR